jgi:hypothetical protein
VPRCGTHHDEDHDHQHDTGAASGATSASAPAHWTVRTPSPAVVDGMTTARPMVAKITSAGQLVAWARSAGPGRVCEWWRGRPAHLPAARRDDPVLAALARQVAQLAAQGRVVPFCVAVEPDVDAYRVRAILRERPDQPHLGRTS